MEIKVLKDIYTSNNSIAMENKEFFKSKKIFVVNMMSSPGSGKTLIIERIAEYFTNNGKQSKLAVIEGDISTTNDAERMSKYNIEVMQINTDKIGNACHLDANMIRTAYKNMNLDGIEVLIIENVGNLVCPASFNLGEDKKITVISITEGEDKPLKYPIIIRNSNLLIINKIDLLPFLDFDINLLKENVKKINSEIEIIECSAKTGVGIEEIIKWFEKEIKLSIGNE